MNLRRSIRRTIKVMLSKGLPDSHRLRYLSYLPCFEAWKNKHAESFPVFEERTGLYRYLNTEVIQNNAIDYLEFGVYKGASIRAWLAMNTHNESRFVGFDTFSGLPEKWGASFTLTLGENAFDAGGELPQIDDQRVSFVEGLFQDTLHDYLTTRSGSRQLVIHSDSDLYSSTLYVLTKCNDVITPGTIIVFDEFASILHEFRALEDYCSAYRRSYDVIGAAPSSRLDYNQLAIQMQ